MSPSAIRSMFTSSSKPATTVVRNDKGQTRPTKSALEIEIERLRAENAALSSKQKPTSKAKPVVQTKVQLVDVNGTKCVEISGNFKPLYLSLAKWNLVKANAELIESLFA